MAKRTRILQATMTRIVVGATSIVLPRFVGEAFGLVKIAGGRGLWPVVEIDTLIFDLLICLVLYYLATGVGAGALRNPMVWLVALMTVGIAVLLTYTISNFGTLFRHRGMIFIGLCLLLVVTRGAASPKRSADGETPPAISY